MRRLGITIDPEAIEEGARLLRDAWSISAEQTAIGYNKGAALLLADSWSFAELDRTTAP